MSCLAELLSKEASSNSQSALGCPGLRSFELLRFLGPLAPQKVVHEVSGVCRLALLARRASRLAGRQEQTALLDADSSRTQCA